MTIKANLNESEHRLTITVVGDFTHKVQKEFRDTYQNSTSPSKRIKEVVVNLSQSTYVDSTAIGMLLVMSDYFKQFNAVLSIANANQNVKSLLQLARIDDIFQVK